ncbi:MAG: class I SAM-dependent methyltransferase [Actinobacteria bacterium]|nr:class I SAM-dependent methyltransferase [Actinomycetota bacterium]
MLEVGSSSTDIRDLIRFQSEAVSSHYDLPPKFFAGFLGPRMAYSCAYFIDENDTLDEAEENKLLLTAKKLDLREGELLLDIGCGWGSFIFYAAEKFGCRAIGITVSEEQAAFVNRISEERGLGDRARADVVHVYDMSYPARYFDKIVTIGAIEHMDNLHLVFSKSSEILKDDGLMLVHGMTKPWHDREEELQGITSEVGELVKEHFGIGYWKSLWEVMEALEKSDFEVLDHENITRHYQLTVERWLERLQENEESLIGKVIDEEKYREFLVFMAGYIVGFETSHTLCNQILCRKINYGEIRPALPLTRENIILSPRKERLCKKN